MTRTTLLTIAACLAACTGQDRDQVGNAYPEACQGDLSHVAASVERVPHDHAWLQLLASPGRPNVARVHLATRTIFVDDRLSGWRLDDATRHEKCHIIAGNWHK